MLNGDLCKSSTLLFTLSSLSDASRKRRKLNWLSSTFCHEIEFFGSSSPERVQGKNTSCTMLGWKIITPLILAQRSFQTSSCCLKADLKVHKQVHMLKKIMAGREKGKRRFIYNENLPKLESVNKYSSSKGQGKESIRRVTVLNKLFMKNITDLMATDKFCQNILGYGLQVG